MLKNKLSHNLQNTVLTTRDRAFPPFQKLIRILVIFTIGCLSTGYAAERASLSWNANAEPNIAGYRLYVGSISGEYNQMVDVGNVTTTTIPNLAAASTYYFSVTAYNSAGFESPTSAEISMTIVQNKFPVTIGAMQRANTGAIQFTLTPDSAPAAFPTGFNIEASSDLVTWTVLQHVPNLPQQLVFTDPDAAFVTRRFYRLSVD